MVKRPYDSHMELIAWKIAFIQCDMIHIWVNLKFRGFDALIKLYYEYYKSNYIQ